MARQLNMIGRTVAGYRILGRIGSGGMGVVYRAVDVKLGREVVLKTLPPELTGDVAHVDRLRREARILASLNHPNIATLFGLEEVGGETFLAMELVDGENLAERLARERPTGDVAVAIARQIAVALAAAHEQSIVHRDLKPSNVMVTAKDDVKVLDFGVAKMLPPVRGEVSAETIAATITPTGAGGLVGTPAYMSPEQLRGESIDVRSDLFSFGVLLYELLTGANPFRRPTLIATLAAVMTETPSMTPFQRRGSDGPAALVSRLLEKSPDDRPPSIVEVLALLAGERCRSELPGDGPYRGAIREGRWRDAYEIFKSLARQRELSPRELEEMAECALWSQDSDACVRLHEQAYAGYVGADQPCCAARVALALLKDYSKRGAPSVARGWLQRAERLLEGQPECVERGHLLRAQAQRLYAAGDHRGAMEKVDEAHAIAQRFNDVDLEALSLHLRGRFLIGRGQVEAGIALVDEAMTAAISGQASPLTVGVLYCNTMGTCELIADYERALEWSELALGWCEPYTASAFPGVCRLHTASALLNRGRWKEAEAHVRQALASFTKGERRLSSEAWYVLGEVERLKGNHADAETHFRKASELGSDPVPGLALLRVAQGRPAPALRLMERAMEQAPPRTLHRAELLTGRVVVALANDRPELAEAAIEELHEIHRTFGCRALRGRALLETGLVALYRGDGRAATGPLLEARAIFVEMGLEYDLASARLQLGRAYLLSEDTEDAQLEAEAAGKAFMEMGAEPDRHAVERLLEDVARAHHS